MPWSQEVLCLQEAILTAIVLLGSFLEGHRIPLLWLLRKDRGQQRHRADKACWWRDCAYPVSLTEHLLQPAFNGSSTWNHLEQYTVPLLSSLCPLWHAVQCSMVSASCPSYIKKNP